MTAIKAANTGVKANTTTATVATKTATDIIAAKFVTAAIIANKRVRVGNTPIPYCLFPIPYQRS